MTRHCHDNPITTVERREMQEMRDAGWVMLDIALAYDCDISTVHRHTKPRLSRAELSARNARIAQMVTGTTPEQREFIARRYGLANVGSLNSTLSAFRRKQRQQSGVQA